MYLITSTGAEQGMMETLPDTENLQILTADALQDNLVFNDETMLAISSESVIDIVKQHTVSTSKNNATTLLKDKVKFRETIATIYPDYTFLKTTIDELPQLKVNKKMVVKPRKGFFATAIHFIDENTDLTQVADKIDQELSRNKKVFDESILSSSELLVEDFIEGKEYAVDMYYDAHGQVQLLNMYYHAEPVHPEYVHMLYYSSKEVFDDIQDKVVDFYNRLNETLQVVNYPIHGEFKLTPDGRLIPIEMNPLRVGGMGLGNMMYWAIGINPYEHMMKGTSPDWEKIWDMPEHSKSIYAYIIAYNGNNVDVMRQKPNIERFKREFSKVYKEALFDYQRSLTFGTFIIKETPESIERIRAIDFDDYFEEL